MNEDDRVVPSSSYGASKCAEEIFCNLYHSFYNVPTIIIRFFNVFGPRQRKYVVYDILNRLKMSS